MGARDARHIIKTIAHLGRHTSFTGNVNFYVYEEQAPILARTMLLLSIFLDQDHEASDSEQAQLFLEIYGNVFLREKSSEIMKELSTKLLRLLCDSTGSLVSLLNFSALRFRDRDDLEVVFKFWRDDIRKTFDIGKLWEMRLRRLHGTRYDVRENMCDWDYHMKLLKQEVTIIHKTEYLRWREHGLAFEVRDSTYDKPNRSMATIDLMKQDGISVPKWGFFNDVITGPFVPFGVESENEDLVKQVNDQHKHTSGDVAEFNILAYLGEYKRNFHSVNSLASRVKVHILPPVSEPFLALKKLQKSSFKFAGIFVSNSCAQHIPKIPPRFVSETTILIVEMARYMLDLKAEQVAAFKEKVLEISKGAGYHFIENGITSTGPGKVKNDDFAIFASDGLDSSFYSAF
ncbi:Dynein assembly factor 3, axonemal [Physocladia obscura]|uniref:Dynein assembly factor 3, axonemal n=1 Tax=Physocladia obscura TaxID=109957 RepID=A0AAD5XCL0_9FUNG|nr:Dynein assembly factor 3, axonemal [Physocladia obscura]